jgi:YidC/Oxa1 family membrane protein insertase
MENLRLFLFFSLAFILLLLWQAWEEDYGPKPTPTVASSSAAIPSAPVANGDVPVVRSAGTAAVPTPLDGAKAQSSYASVTVTSDLYRLEIDTKGGNIVKVFLNDYPETMDQESIKFQLLTSDLPNLYVAQSGLIAGEGISAPSHEAIYQADQQSYEMAEDTDQLQIDLHWQSEDGIQVTKRFTLNRGSYLINVEHIVSNRSGNSWTGREYRQLVRTVPQEDGGIASNFIYTYTGAALYSDAEKYEKYSFDDMEEKKLARDVKGGWIAMLQHYFLGAWVPPADQDNHFYSNVLSGKRYVVGAYTQPVTVANDGSHTFNTGFVAGPKLQDELEQISTGLELSVDYGWLTVVAKPIFWLLKKIQAVVINWGLSIILLTLLIKLIFFKLSEASYKSMANMRRMTPRIKALKDRFGDDKTRLNTAMMELYKKEKINPLGGCLPIVVQIPVFIALYWVLLESVELRQAPFIFWIEDLAVKDPYFILPLIMGISMFIQQKLNPAPPDPMQAKIMMSLPFVFTIFFAFFPSGLVLYWVTNNILSISQQYYITRKIEQAHAGK